MKLWENDWTSVSVCRYQLFRCGLCTAVWRQGQGRRLREDKKLFDVKLIIRISQHLVGSDTKQLSKFRMNCHLRWTVQRLTRPFNFSSLVCHPSFQDVWLQVYFISRMYQGYIFGVSRVLSGYFILSLFQECVMDVWIGFQGGSKGVLWVDGQTKNVFFFEWKKH